MTDQRLPSDIISNLPSDIIQKILTHSSVRDAFKTSVLSRTWRYQCLKIPKLEFNDELLRGSSLNELPNKYKALLDIYTILLLHHGPTLEFSLNISQLKSCCQIDQIILRLSRSASTTLEKFTLCIGSGICHQLPSSFFSLQKVTHLTLGRCAIHYLSSFSRFSRLTSLCFYDVNITKGTLLRFLRCCPLLKNFTLIDHDQHFTGSGCLNFVDLLRCLPLIEQLHMNRRPVQLFASDIILSKFTNLRVHLKALCLSGLSFVNTEDLRSILLFVTSSPNIEKIDLEMCKKTKEIMPKAVMNLFDLQDYSYVSLDHLRELVITNLSGMKPEMDFLKLILAKSVMLKKAELSIDSSIVPEHELSILREVLEFPRASSRARIIAW